MTGKRIPAAFEPAKFDQQHAYAIRALAAGNASEGQQRLALDWIVSFAAAYDDLSYRPGVDGDRETSFHEGRRFVGAQIRRMLAFKSEELERLARA